MTRVNEVGIDTGIELDKLISGCSVFLGDTPESIPFFYDIYLLPLWRMDITGRGRGIIRGEGITAALSSCGNLHRGMQRD